MSVSIKDTLLLLLFICTSIAATAQKNTPAERFLAYYNNHQIDSLDILLADDFVFNRSFVKDSLAGKKEFLGSFMHFYTAFNARYDIAKITYDGNNAIVTAVDAGDDVKFMQLAPAPWRLIIQSQDGKVTSFKMESTRGSGTYFNELTKKTKTFRTWASTKYAPSILAKIDGDVSVYHQLLEEYYDTHPMAYHFTANKSGYPMPCTHYGKLLLKQRLARYPFSKAKNVVLVSFTDTVNYPDYVSVKKRIPDFAAVPYKKELSATDIDKLTDLLFNVGYNTKDIFVNELIPCAARKNAIVFLDANGEPFDYIGVFWRCGVLEYDINKIELPISCDDKYDLIRRFFVERGLPVAVFSE